VAVFRKSPCPRRRAGALDSVALEHVSVQFRSRPDFRDPTTISFVVQLGLSWSGGITGRATRSRNWRGKLKTLVWGEQLKMQSETVSWWRSAGCFMRNVSACSFVLSSMLCAGCSDKDTTTVSVNGAGKFDSPSSAKPLAAETVRIVENFCGDCHPMPSPLNFPKDRWEEEVLQGYDFYIASRRSDLIEPSREDAIRYFTEAAPDEILVQRADAMPQFDSETEFVRMRSGLTTIGVQSSISHLVAGDTAGVFFSADMQSGEIRKWSIESREAWTSVVVGNGRNSCRLVPCDWNNDGFQDLLVGEIGSYGVGDHSNGRVSLMLGRPDGSFTSSVLADGLARVVEPQPFDYDSDGDLDVLVAEFGYLETGALKLLRNVGSFEGQPKFEIEVLDPRHGALGVRVADIDADGNQDFVVAFGQEHETVEVFYQTGPGQFRREVVLQLPGPSYNSSSLEVADVDQDGLLDIVHTNGDTLDTFLAKPYHGVRWIRNLGGGEWANTELGLLVGALQAVVCDLDADGDYDIAAVGMFPLAGQESPGAYDSICWWEQTKPREFVRHSVERDNCNYACCLSIDANLDGRLDLLMGNWSAHGNADAITAFLGRMSGKVD
jgi:hypothetical protein